VRRFVVGLLLVTMLGVACGGGGSDGSSKDASGPSTTEDAGTPKPGGKLVYGLEADTSSPWTPQSAVCAISCHMVMRSVFDTLTLPNAKTEVEGNLLESFDHNADYTEWTLHVRPGITFHDGTPLDGAAVSDNLNRHLKSFLTGKTLSDVSSITTSGPMDVVVKTKRSWSHFPLFLAGQIGYIASPKWLAEVDKDPAKAAQPVGTGPFIFKSYTPGKNFVADKNPNYWRKGLPYLDEIEYRFIPDGDARKSALLSGDLDIIHSSNGEVITQLSEDKDINLIKSEKYGETSYTLLRVDDSTEAGPLSDVTVRRAMAMAVDRPAYAKARTRGVAEAANGPFPPGTMGYLKDSGYPDYDPKGAKKLIDAYEAKHGPVKITLTTTNDAFNLASYELESAYWKAAGIDVTIKQVEQGQFIVNALKGDIQAFGWRNHGGFDPDTQNFWWDSDAALPSGQLALNFGRIKDEVIDQNLDTIRTSNDPAERKAAAEAINKRFGSQVYNIWEWWTVWGIASQKDVHDIGSSKLPSGDDSIFGAGIGGTHQVAQIWKG
jgi:peptide/nickel transport system substrate-binding protein